MKRIFTREFWKLPDFWHNRQLRLIAVLLTLIVVLCAGMACWANWIVGIVVLVLGSGMLGTVYAVLRQITRDTNNYIANLSHRIDQGEQEALIRMPIGVLFYNNDNVVEWLNPYMQQYFGKEDVLGKPLGESAPQLMQLITKYQDDKKPVEVTWQGNTFRMMIQQEINAVYLMDITHYAEIQQEYDDSRVVIGQIFLDNYDEVTESMSDKRVSNLSNFITNELSDWARQFGLFLKRIDEDHFFLVGYAKMLAALEKDKFQILDLIRERTAKTNFPVTLSMGIAFGSADLASLSGQAQRNLDLALGRGGDQVVVRGETGDARFYGGKTNPMEKRTRVRARMISQALQELISQSSQVLVMGHQQPDMDALGASLGIRRIAAMNGKECKVVVNPEKVHTDVERLLAETAKYPELDQVIVTPKEALAMATDDTLLIMVDHFRPSIAISPELYERLKARVVVIDHHRRSEEFPENPQLVYIEPYASSTCELVTEMFEYQSRDSEPIDRLEATAMLAGIVVDTQSFANHTGTRTFDAASFLRSAGADAQMVRHFMRESMHNFMQRNHLIDRAEFIDDNVIVTGEEDRQYDPVTAAQAADALLDVSGVEASFVITRRDKDTVGVSARSIGKTNVQLVMEKFGGGGHLANAAAQLTDVTIADTKQRLLAILNGTADEEEPAEEDAQANDD